MVLVLVVSKCPDDYFERMKGGKQKLKIDVDPRLVKTVRKSREICIETQIRFAMEYSTRVGEPLQLLVVVDRNTQGKRHIQLEKDGKTLECKYS